MALDNIHRNKQADSQSLEMNVEAFHAVITLKYPFNIFLADANSKIFYRNGDLVAFFNQVNLDGLSIGRIFYGVAQQVDKHLFQPLFIAVKIISNLAASHD